MGYQGRGGGGGYRGGGGRGVSYTPFAADAMGQIAFTVRGGQERARQKQVNKLSQAAWMGDPIALQELTAMDPDMAMKVEDQAMQRQEKETVRNVEKDTQFKTDLTEISEQIGTFETFEDAQEFGNRMTDWIIGKYPERAASMGMTPGFTEKDFAEIVQITGGAGMGEDWETVGSHYPIEHPVSGKPATAIVMHNKKSGQTYEKMLGGAEGGSSLVRMSGLDVERAGELAGVKAKERERAQTEEKRAQASIQAGTVAVTKLPGINRALELNDLVDTSGRAEDLLAMQQYLGWKGEGDEVANKAELQQLLAVQMFDVLANFRGAISEGELKTAERLSTGLGKNNDANRKILIVLQRKLQRAVENAKRLAIDRKDTTALLMLEDFDPYAAEQQDDAALPKAVAPPRGEAPPAALAMLQEDPTPEALAEFESAFGYRPAGF